MKHKLLVSVVFLLLILPMGSQRTVGAEVDTTKIGISPGEEYWFSVVTNNYTHPSSGKQVGFPLSRNSFGGSIVIEKGELLGFLVIEVSNSLLNASYTYGSPDDFDNATIVTKTTDMSIIRSGLVVFNDWEYWEDIWNVPIYGENLASGIYNREIAQNEANFTVIITLTYGFLTEYELKEQYVYEKSTGVLLEARTTKQVIRGSSDSPMQEQLVIRIDRPDGIDPFGGEEEGSSGFLSWNPWASIFAVLPLTLILVYRRKR